MLLDIIWTVIGLVLILVGANALTDGASSIASRLGVSDLVVGLTVVAMGTSAPELVVSLMAAISGNAPLAIGNIVGSNILNILLVIGITAMIKPIVVDRSVMSIEIPIVIMVSVVMLVLGNTSVLDPGSQNVITRVEGIFLLIAFMLYMRHTFLSAKIGGDSDEAGEQVKKMPVWRSVVYIIGGLAALIWGGDKFVDGASAVASSLGVSDAIIGLTIVAIGTSLPELATSIIAAMKGKGALAIGNVVGSNILNVFFILGVSATVHPLPFGGINNVDLIMMLISSLLFLLFGWIIKERTITRGEGTFMTLLYIAYTVYLITSI